MNIINNHTPSNKNLLLFVGIQIVNIFSITVDYMLQKTGNRTITSYSVEYPIIGAVIVLVETISPISLAFHFFYEKNNNHNIEEFL
jgi:hypothetical protein